MKVLLIGETRKEFTGAASGEGNATVLGSYEAYDIRFTPKFRAPWEATITVAMSRKEYSMSLVPSSKPGSTVRKYQRAKYVSFTGPSNNKVVMVITDAQIDFSQKAYEGNFANVTINCKDPRVWLTTMPGDLTNPPAKFTGTVENLLIEISKRCSNSDFSGKKDWQKLPMTALGSFTPNANQTKLGIVATSQLPDTGVTFDLNDPNPPEDDVQNALVLAGRDFELYPLLTYGTDGTDAPWWRWVVRKRQTLKETLSEEVGAIMVQNFNSDLLINESLWYDEESKTYALGNGKAPLLSGHYGPWFGAEMSSGTPPKGAEIRRWLKRRARAATQGLKSVQVDIDVDSKALSIKNLLPGTYVKFNMNGVVFPLAVDELNWSYNYQVGDWTLEDWSL